MKALFCLATICICSLGKVYAQDYPIQAVPFTQVKLDDKFWMPRIETNRTVTIPASFERCQSTGRVKNFLMAAQKEGKFCTTFPFDDTDIYKTLEGAAFSLAVYPDAKLDAYLDSLIKIIASAQEADGFLYTARTINPAAPHAWAGKMRWEKERELSHELYNAGHLYEAAAAHYLATKKRNLLNIALKNADLVCAVFGPGKRHVAPGHEIVEMGLVKLYRITGKKEYLSTAKFFIDERGRYKGYDTTSKDSWKSGAYWQDHKPVVLQDEAEGHAVRAGYLYSAVADLAALSGDDSLLTAINKIWENVVTKKIYVQGGAGAFGDGERYGGNYELPNGTAYNETCAAISNVYWNQRMFQLHGHAKYIDLLEKILYNGLISGIGLDGKSFFYTNALEIKNSFSHKHMEAERSGWFECSCCPTNLARFIPSIPGYVYAQNKGDLYVNLFINGTAQLSVLGRPVNITQQNNYPWDGGLTFKIDPAKQANLNLMIRIPGWAQDEAIPSNLYTFATASVAKPTLLLNGKAVAYEMVKGYASIRRSWKKGDVVTVQLPMDVRRVVANENVKDDLGKIALQRGPLVYCAEWVDNFGKASNLILPKDLSFTTEFKPGLLNGVTVIQSTIPSIVIKDAARVETQQAVFTAIPYYSWANRGKGEMQVWFPQQLKDINLIAH